MENSRFIWHSHFNWYKRCSTLPFALLTSPDSRFHLIHLLRDIRFNSWLEILDGVGPLGHFDFNGGWVFLLGNTLACE